MVQNPRGFAASEQDEQQNDSIEALEQALASSLLSGRVSTIQPTQAVAKYKPGDETLVLCRVFLPEGTYRSMEAALIKGKNNKECRLGVYADANGVPSGALLATTPAIDASQSGVFISGQFAADLIVSNGAHYWIGIICDDKKIELASSMSIKEPVAGLIRREKSKYDESFGALPNSWDNSNEGAIPLLRIIEA